MNPNPKKKAFPLLIALSGCFVGLLSHLGRTLLLLFLHLERTPGPKRGPGGRN